MATSHPPFPEFDDPPVVETVVGIHFQPLPRFDVAQRVFFWNGLRDAFPNLEEKPPAEQIREVIGDPSALPGVQVRWQLTDALPSPRLWAKSTDGRHTIQIQQDALLVNWERDPAATTPYWPYTKRRKDLADKLSALDAFAQAAKIGEIRPTTCFASYINHIEFDRPDEFPAVLARSLTMWRNETSDGWLPPVEQANLHLTFLLPEQRGRLHVNIAPGFRLTDRKPILRIDLTARGTLREQSIEAALSWTDLGHEWIVRGFTSLTTPEMHRIWGRKQ